MVEIAVASVTRLNVVKPQSARPKLEEPKVPGDRKLLLKKSNSCYPPPPDDNLTVVEALQSRLTKAIAISLSDNPALRSAWDKLPNYQRLETRREVVDAVFKNIDEILNNKGLKITEDPDGTLLLHNPDRQRILPKEISEMELLLHPEIREIIESKLNCLLLPVSEAAPKTNLRTFCLDLWKQLKQINWFGKK
jgi:hypothetical protein